MIASLLALPRRTWVRAAVIGTAAAVVIAVPAGLIDTRLFGRPIEPRAIDYVILGLTAALIGLILAIRPEATGDGSGGEEIERQDARTAWGGFVSFLAVGCPVCNQAVVALVGTSGALSWWAPVQPVIGAIAVAILVWTLRLRLRTYRVTACSLPRRAPSPVTSSE